MSIANISNVDFNFKLRPMNYELNKDYDYIKTKTVYFSR